MEAVRLSNAQQERAIYNKVDGDWDKLTAEDKATFLKLTGFPEEKSKNMWVIMKYGLNGAPPGKGAGGPK